MQSETVDDILTHYKEYKGRCNSIKAEISLLEHTIEARKRNAVNDFILPGRRMDGSLSSSGVSKPTERVAIRLADGYMPDDVIEMQRRVEWLQEEIKRLEIYIVLADAWLTGLTERERFVIENHVLNALPWRIVIHKYSNEYGEIYSKEGLGRIKRGALEKIHAMAQ